MRADLLSPSASGFVQAYAATPQREIALWALMVNACRPAESVCVRVCTSLRDTAA